MQLKDTIPAHILLGHDSQWEPLHQYKNALFSIVQRKHFDKSTPQEESKHLTIFNNNFKLLLQVSSKFFFCFFSQ